ncbi:hypothetical protein BH09PAT2_BH09PAT2_05460 [soil metagenome]
MQTTQVQIKISLSEQLNNLLQNKAERLGVPVTQFVKYIIMKEVEKEEYPTYQMSENAEEEVKQAMQEYKNGNAVDVKNISEFFKNL